MELNDQKKKNHKSGSLKRKEYNKKRLNEIASKSKKLKNYFTPTVLSQNFTEQQINPASNEIECISEKCVPNSPLKSQVHNIISNIDSIHCFFSTFTSISTDIQIHSDLQHIDIVDKINFNYFIKPSGKQNIQRFFSFHPHHPEKKHDGTQLPFNTSKAYYVAIPGSQKKIKRNWLTFSYEHNYFFCSICLVYSSKKSVFTSVEGFEDWVHVYERIKDHEESKNHREASKCYMSDNRGQSVDGLFNRVQWSQREHEVIRRRKVAESIIEIVKVIGKQGLPFRGFRYEAAYNLNNTAVNHGNFLEIVLLIAKSNIDLNDHITKPIVESEKRAKSGKTGRGNLFTFLSLTTVTNIIQTICKLLLLKISEEV